MKPADKLSLPSGRNIFGAVGYYRSIREVLVFLTTPPLAHPINHLL